MSFNMSSGTYLPDILFDMLTQQLEASIFGHMPPAHHIHKYGISEWFRNIIDVVVKTYRSAICHQP